MVDPGAPQHTADDMMPVVYDELRALAQHMLGDERRGHTLDATALVNEAYLKLAGLEHAAWRDAAHFRAGAAHALRLVLVDHARRRNRQKRGGGAARITLQSRLLADGNDALDVIDLDDALRTLESQEPRVGKVVELRFFAGFSIVETADALDIGTATVERDWRFARAWLYSQIFDDDPRLDRDGACDAGERGGR